MKNRFLFIPVLGLLCAFVVTLAPPLLAQTVKREAARPTATVEGSDTYRSYCATCHGIRGTGNGPAAPALKASPTDLTRLARKAGGTFSARDVEDAILGRNKSYAAHGSGEMPIWGPIFRALNSSDTALVTLRVTNLVAYIKGLQVK